MLPIRASKAISARSSDGAPPIAVRHAPGEPDTVRRPVPGPAQAVVVGLLRIYKLMISPLFAGSCRFAPSCSDYAREAVLEHGVIKGGWLAARRLGRCHPLGSSGFDPVPPRAPRV